jgi:SAM-dependent methyltransferase
LGAEAVAAVDPSAAFVAAARELLPGVDVRQASAEALPFPDDAFDIALAALVVHFMSDPVAGIAEMARVTRPGGFVAASVWDYENERSPVSAFWRAAGDLDPEAPGELQLPGVREGQLLDYFERAGLRDVRPTTLAVHVEVAGFDDWWEPYTLGTGPAGAYVAGLDAQRRAALRAHCAELLPDGPFTVDASAWAATGRVRST